MQIDPIECIECGEEFPFNEGGLVFGMGSGPEGYCRKCRPPGTVEEIIRTLNTFMGKE